MTCFGKNRPRVIRGFAAKQRGPKRFVVAEGLPKAMNWLSDAEFTRLSHFASIVAMRIDNVVIVDQTGARSRPPRAG